MILSINSILRMSDIILYPGTGRKGENSSIMIEGVGEIIVGAGVNSQMLLIL